MYISSKCSIAVHCLIFINEYGEQKKVTSTLLALSTGANPVTIRNILSSLKKDGMISNRFGTGGAMIQTPLQEITLYRICMAVEPEAVDKMMGIHPSPSSLCPVGKNINRVLQGTYSVLQQDIISSMKSITMQNILDDYLATLAH